MWILLEVGRLNSWRTLLNDPSKYEFYYILDDMITDKTKPRGHKKYTISCQNKIQTYQFNENNSNLEV